MLERSHHTQVSDVDDDMSDKSYMPIRATLGTVTKFLYSWFNTTEKETLGLGESIKMLFLAVGDYVLGASLAKHHNSGHIAFIVGVSKPRLHPAFRLVSNIIDVVDQLRFLRSTATAPAMCVLRTCSPGHYKN
jgi:hypothetical protein